MPSWPPDIPTEVTFDVVNYWIEERLYDVAYTFAGIMVQRAFIT